MQKKVAFKISKEMRARDIESLKIRKESLDYLRENGFKTVDDIIDRQDELPTENYIKGNILAGIIFGKN